MKAYVSTVYVQIYNESLYIVVTLIVYLLSTKIAIPIS